MSTEVTEAGRVPLLEVPETPPRELAISVRHVHKSYRVPTNRVDTLKERVAHPFRSQEMRELRALGDVSFEVERGEFFGIVGRNGSGKSSLLKLLASIYRADGGSIRIAGRVAPFIELGVGFNLELSALDNVLLNGVMMGLTAKEAQLRFDEVIEFAELEEFKEMKLKNYSSGMLVRLGFSLMTQVDADVLLIDEVLAVGDAAFQQKCFDAFGRLHQEGRTIVLVTHDMVAVQSHCDRAILIDSGEIVLAGNSGDVARRYLELNFESRKTGIEAVDVGPAADAAMARFVDVRVVDASNEPTASLKVREPIKLEATIEARGHIADPVFAFQIVNSDGLPIFAPKPFGLAGAAAIKSGDRVVVRGEIQNRLAPGHYFVHCAVGRSAPGESSTIAFRKHAADFVVYGTEPFTGLVELECETSAELESK